MTDQQSGGRQDDGRRCGFIAVLGAPNAGKSTLVNTLVGAKVAIVSRKAQTTRMAIRGIAIEGRSQLVFTDTPGIFAPKRRLDRAMVKAAWGAAADADAVLLVVDAAKGAGDELEPIFEKFAEFAGPRVLALNKIDHVPDKERLLGLAAEISARVSFQAVFMISATTGSGVAALKAGLAELAPPGPWHFPEDDISDAPLRMLAAEITREKIYNRLHEELPYAITVETSGWTEFRNGSVRIEQTIFVERDGQKAIVLGAGGRTIKQISTEARVEIAQIVEKPVHLFLFVKVRENWGSDPERYRELGLEFPKD